MFNYLNLVYLISQLKHTVLWYEEVVVLIDKDNS